LKRNFQRNEIDKISLKLKIKVMKILEAYGSHVIKKGTKFLTKDYKWSSQEGRSVCFDTKEQAMSFLKGKKIKGSIYVNKSIHKIRSRENGSTIVEFESKLVKI
jgi:hypothetical protein